MEEDFNHSAKEDPTLPMVAQKIGVSGKNWVMGVV